MSIDHPKNKEFKEIYEDIMDHNGMNGRKKHIIQEGSRRHVVSWNSNIAICSEPDCEMNIK
jgi:hypothetical protein